MALGIRRGQSLSQAQALCGTLLTDTADPLADAAALADMARWCNRISPLTAPDLPDGLWIDIAGCAHLFGGERRLAERLQQRLAPCRLAIADTAGAAWALARTATRTEIEIAPPGQHAQAIANLPTALLRIETRIVAGLHHVGLRSVEALLRLPRAEITARFGPEPVRQLDRALGRASEPISWLQPEQEWRVQRPFVEPISTPEALSEALMLLAQELCARLEALRLGGTRFCARFFGIDGGEQTLIVTAAAPLHKPLRLARLFVDRLDAVEPGLGIEALAVVAEAVAPLALSQSALDDTAEGEELPETLDTLTNRLGALRLWRPEPQASHIPERSWVARSPLAKPVHWPSPPGRRPLRLLSKPEPIEAMALVPDDPPIRFRWRGALHRVRAASLPERIAAEWWRRSDVEERFRDYYRVEDEHGTRFWVFRTSQSGEAASIRWFMHGLFG